MAKREHEVESIHFREIANGVCVTLIVGGCDLGTGDETYYPSWGQAYAAVAQRLTRRPA